VSLKPPMTVGKLWTALHTKAKNSLDHRFHALRRGPMAGRTGGHVRFRVRQWLCAKFKVAGQGKAQYPDAYLSEELKLFQLQRTSRPRRSWANV
jgi:hypothetical protein